MLIRRNGTACVVTWLALLARFVGQIVELSSWRAGELASWRNGEMESFPVEEMEKWANGQIWRKKQSLQEVQEQLARRLAERRGPI